MLCVVFGRVVVLDLDFWLFAFGLIVCFGENCWLFWLLVWLL